MENDHNCECSICAERYAQLHSSAGNEDGKAVQMLLAQLIVVEAEHPGNVRVVDQRIPAGVYDRSLAAANRLATQPQAAQQTRRALRRLHLAIKALGNVGSNGVTLFEDSPTKSQEAFEAWTELNGAQSDAAEALKLKLLFGSEWLENKIKADPDLDCEAGSPLTRPK